MASRRWLTSAALAALLGIAAGASAQSNGIVEGTVADRSGARLPGVTIECRTQGRVRAVRGGRRRRRT